MRSDFSETPLPASLSATSSSPRPPPHPARIAAVELLMTPSRVLEDLSILLWSLLRTLLPSIPPWDTRVRTLWSHLMLLQGTLITTLVAHVEGLIELARTALKHYRSADVDERVTLAARLRRDGPRLAHPYKRLLLGWLAWAAFWWLWAWVIVGDSQCTRCTKMMTRFPLGSTVGDVICAPSPEGVSKGGGEGEGAVCLERPSIRLLPDAVVTVEHVSPYCEMRVHKRRAETVDVADSSGRLYHFKGAVAYQVQMLLEIQAGKWPC